VGFGDDPRPSSCQVAWLDQRQALDAIKPAAHQAIGAIEPPGVPTADVSLEEDTV
jgi:hypothetical protein